MYCPGCKNIDKELQEAREAAQKAANETGVSQAIYVTPTGYDYASALYACQNYMVKEVVIPNK
jgi:hypothetical protein